MYWKPYRGQHIAVYDEFLATKELDPILDSLNQIGSTAEFNMPGAELYDKVQPCNFKVLFCISNRHHIPLGNKLADEAAAAMFSRFHRYEFINLDQRPNQPRDKIPRKEDFSNIECIYFTSPATSKSKVPTDITVDPGYKISLDVMKDNIIQVISDKKRAYDEYLQKREPVEEVVNKVEDQSYECQNLAYLFLGEPLTGKSTNTRNIARRLGIKLNMPVIDITSKDFDSVEFMRPSIFVIHDRLADEEAYVHFYDRIPKPSIILNSSNGKVIEAGWFSRLFNAQHKSTSILSAIANMWKCAQVPIRIYKGNRQTNIEPGFGRRIGITGNVKHCGYISFRPEDQGGLYYCEPGFKITRNNELTNWNDVANTIYRDFRNATTGGYDIIFEQVKTLPQVSCPDVLLHCRDTAQLFDVCSSTTNMMKAYCNGTKTTPEVPYVELSPRCMASEYRFVPDMFILKKSRRIDDVVDMAHRTFSALKMADASFTCEIKTSQFNAVCSGNKISWKDESSDIVTSYYTHTEEKIGDQMVVVIRKMEVSKKNEEPKEVSSRVYSREVIINALINGFQFIDASCLEECDYITTLKDHFCEAYPILVNKVRLEAVSAQTIQDSRIAHNTAWEVFKKTPIYKVVVVLGVIMISLTVIMSIVGIVKLCLAGSDKKEKAVKHTTGKIKYKDIHAKAVYSHIDKINDVDIYACTIHLEDPLDESETPEFMNNVAACDADTLPEADVVSHTIITPQGAYVREVKAKGQAKNRHQVIRKYIPEVNTVAKEAGINNNIHNENVRNVRKKVLGNMSIISSYSTGCTNFALRICDRYVLTPAHIWKKVGDKGLIRLPPRTSGGGETRSEVTLKYVNFDIDVACVEIDDKSVDNAPSILKYFHRKENFMTMTGSVLCRYDVKRAVHTPEWWKTPIGHYFGNVTRAVFRAPGDDNGKSMLRFEQYTMQGVPTEMGDCGQVYFCTQNEVGTNIILGMHTGKDLTTEAGQASSLDVDTVAAIVAICRRSDSCAPITIHNNIGQQGTNVLTRYDIPEHVLKVDHPQYDSSVQMALDSYYYDWITDLEDETTSDMNLFYPHNPNSQLVCQGYDRNYRPSYIGKDSHAKCPWSADVEQYVPNQLQLSVVRLSQLTPERQQELPILHGRRSILAEQVSFYNDVFKWGDPQTAMLGHAADILSKRYNLWYGGPHRVLTELETINGLIINPRDPWFEGLQGMDLKASAGDYPKRRHNIMTKNELFTPLDLGVSDKVLYTWKLQDSRVYDIYERYHYISRFVTSTGNRIITPMQDNLKREVCKPGKSRCFQSMSVEETMLIRRYTGTVLAAFMKNYPRAYCQVGIDPYVEFQALYYRFKRISQIGEAGDYSRYDKHLLPQVIRAAMKLLYGIFESGHDGTVKKDILDNVWKVMTHIIIYSLSIMDGVVYIKMRGNPSGNPLTSVLNSVVNDLYNTMYIIHTIEASYIYGIMKEHALLKAYCKYTHRETRMIKTTTHVLEELVDWADYGDDFVMVVHPQLTDIVNFASKQRYLERSMGIKYDTPEKDGHVYMTKPLSSLSFLSRKFNMESGVCVPTLKEATLYSYFHWATSNTPEQISALMRDAFTEAALHEEQVYNACLRAFQVISRYYQDRHITLPFMPLNFREARRDALMKIKFGRTAIVGSQVYPEPEEGPIRGEVRVRNSVTSSDNDCLDEHFRYYKDIYFELQSAIMTPTEIMALLDCAMLQIDFSKLILKDITGYRAYPAHIQTLNSGDYYSVMFDLKTTDPDVDIEFKDLQSDMMKILNQLSVELFTLRLVTMCTRKFGNEVHRAAQVHLNYHDEGSALMVANPEHQVPQCVGKTITSYVASSTLVTQELQASGTAEMPVITQSTDGTGGYVTVLPTQQNHVSPKALEASPWIVDARDAAHRIMETIQSPVLIPVNTPPGTLITTISLGELATMSPTMRVWAGVNSETCATQVVRFESVTAATMINSFRFGFAVQKKSVYTAQEIMLIHSDDITVTDTAVEMRLRIAAVSDDRNIPNRYTFVETHPVNTKIPTIVVMTRTTIQNAFQNDSISVNFKIFSWFENETGQGSAFRMTAEDLNKGFPDAVTGASVRSRGGQTLADLLHIDPGRPFFITCDGTFTGRPYTSKWNGTSTYSMVRALPSTNIYADPKIYTKLEGIRAECHLDITYGTLTAGEVHPYSGYTSIEDTLSEVPVVNGFALRRTLSWNSDHTSVLVPCLRNYAFVPTSLPDPLSVTAYLDEVSTQSDLRHDIRKSSLIDPKNFMILTSVSNEPLPIMGFSYSQTVDISSGTEEDYYNEFNTAYVDFLEGQGWDVFVKQIEIDGVVAHTEPQHIYSINTSAPITPSATYQSSSGVFIHLGNEVDPANDTGFLERRAWEFGKIMRMYTLFHPDFGTRVGILFSRMNNYSESEFIATSPYIKSFNGIAGTYSNAYSTNDSISRQPFRASVRISQQLTISNFPAIEALVSRAEKISMEGHVTLAPNESRLIFSQTLPTTLTQTMAADLVGTEVNDPTFHNLWDNWLTTQGIAEDARVTFSLSNRVNTSAIASVIYDRTYKTFYTINNAVTPIERFRVYPKLTYEDAVMFNFAVLPTDQINAAISTNTTNWISRVVSDTSTKRFNGRNTANIVRYVSGSRINTQLFQAEEAAMALAGAGSGALDAISKLLGYKLVYSQMNKMQQKEFENKMALLQEKYKQEQGLITARAEANSITSPLAQSMTAASRPIAFQSAGYTNVPPPDTEPTRSGIYRIDTQVPGSSTGSSDVSSKTGDSASSSENTSAGAAESGDPLGATLSSSANKKKQTNDFLDNYLAKSDNSRIFQTRIVRPSYKGMTNWKGLSTSLDRNDPFAAKAS